jgi:FkbM family methyltransferase
MQLTGRCAGLVARVLSSAWPRAARRFGFWYRRQTVLHPRWCSPIGWETTVRLPNGAAMAAPFREVQGMSLILDACWEPEVTERILNNLKPGDVFIDAGANMGYYSLLASKAVGPDGLAIAFEPSAANLRHLLANLAINDCSNVVVISMALSDRAEVAKLWSAPYYNTGVCSLRDSRFVGPADFHLTGTARLDDFQMLRDLGPRASVLKVDVEGLELKVLRGAEALLRASPRLRVVCELSPEWYSSAELVNYLQSLGYHGEYYSAGVWGPLAGVLPTRQCNAWFWRD